jgi:serine/threonine-protein kinase
MKLKGPIITLLAGVVVAGVLYTLNIDLSNDTARNADAKAKAAAATSAAGAAGAAAGAANASPSAAAPASSAAAAPAAPHTGKATYAGAVDGGAASLAIAVSNGKAIAYVCDGKVAEAWLNGTFADGKVTMTGPKGSLDGTYTAAQATGYVTAGTKQWHFTIKAVAPPSGLYRSAASLRNKLDASWYVGPNGEQVGLARDPRTGDPVEVKPFDLNTRSITVNGETIPVESVTPENPGS